MGDEFLKLTDYERCGYHFRTWECPSSKGTKGGATVTAVPREVKRVVVVTFPWGL